MQHYFDKFPDSYVTSSQRFIQTPGSFAVLPSFMCRKLAICVSKKVISARRKNLESFLIVLVLSGSGVLMYDGKLYSLSHGSCFFIDCMVPYYHQSSESDPGNLSGSILTEQPPDNITNFSPL